MAGQKAVTSAKGGTAARKAAKETPAPPRQRSGRPDAKAPPEAKRRADTTTRRQLDPDALAALEEERDFLLTSLRDLEREHDAGDVDDTDYDALKDDYTARAAGVIRAIDDRQTRAQQVRSERRRSPGRIAAIVAAVLAVAIVAGVLVAQAAGRRDTGDSLSGDIRQTSRDQLLKAQQQIGEGKLLDAIKTYDQVLAEQPANREALTYKGWLLYRVSASSTDGQLGASEVQALRDRALESLGQAVQVDPSYADAHIFRAIIFNDTGRTSEALAELNLVPTEQVPEFMRERVDQLRQKASSGTTQPAVPARPPTT